MLEAYLREQSLLRPHCMVAVPDLRKLFPDRLSFDSELIDLASACLVDLHSHCHVAALEDVEREALLSWRGEWFIGVVWR